MLHKLIALGLETNDCILPASFIDPRVALVVNDQRQSLFLAEEFARPGGLGNCQLVVQGHPRLRTGEPQTIKRFNGMCDRRSPLANAIALGI